MGIIEMVSKKQNCWEYMKCGREPGGEKVAELGICRAAADELTPMLLRCYGLNQLPSFLYDV
jgi:hypothetical protein